MPSAASLLALPPGTDPDSGVSVVVPFTGFGLTRDAEVPGGSVWVPVMLQISCDTSAAVGPRVWTVVYFDPAFQVVGNVSSPAAFDASVTCFATFALGVTAASAQDSNSNVWQMQALPVAPLWSGCTVRAQLRGSFGGDQVPGAFAGEPALLVMQFAAGGGGGVVEPQLPSQFSYVFQAAGGETVGLAA